MNEFDLIDHLTAQIKNNSRDIHKGIGDDAAVIKYNKHEYFLITTDSIAENVHFKLSWPIPDKKLFYFLGWKALAVNISDIFAMGGYPYLAVAGLHLPGHVPPSLLKILYQGLQHCADKYQVALVGGNICRTNRDFIISITACGKVKKEYLLLRSGAKNNDHIYIQNGVGLSAYGLKLLNRSRKVKENMILPHLKPEPASLIPLLSRYRIHSCIDISDGLVSDLAHILKGSKKGAEIDLELLSEQPGVQGIPAEILFPCMLYGGEDYRLLFTSPDVINHRQITRIGRIIPSGGIYLLNKGRKKRINTAKGYRHF